MDEIKVLLLKPRLRIDEAAQLLDVSKRTVQRYLDEGLLTSIETPGGHRRVITDSLKKYL